MRGSCLLCDLGRSRVVAERACIGEGSIDVGSSFDFGVSQSESVYEYCVYF